MHVRRSTCRSCDSSNLETILSLGSLPLPSALLREPQLKQEQPAYPLDLAWCRDCSLVQALQTVSPTLVYDDSFRHYSSTAESNQAHAQQLAESLKDARGLDHDSLVVEIGSNDGYLLKHFQASFIPVLGIDPAPGQAQTARRNAIPTLATFFVRETGRYLYDQGRHADVVIANNVLDRVADVHGFISGVRMLLKDDGVAIIENQYVRNLVDECQFDAIHHEHLCYWSVTAMDALARSEDLFLNHVEYFPIHGGTMRYHLGKQEDPSSDVQRYLQDEHDGGLDSFEYYADFAQRIEEVKQRLLALLQDLKADGARIAGYGAAAEGSTLLNLAGIGRETIEYVVDPNPHAHGRYLPGTRLPVAPAEQLQADAPDYLLLLSCAFREEAMLQQEAYRQNGGRFVVPLPSPAIV